MIGTSNFGSLLPMGTQITPERKQFGLRLAVDLMRALKHLAVDEGKPMNELVEEALRELLQKHRRKISP